MQRYPVRPAAFVLPLIALSCAPLARVPRNGGGETPILSTAMGPALRAMWESSGGLRAWRRFGTVRFTHQAEILPGAPGELRPGLADPELGAATEPRRIGPEEVSFRLGEWKEIQVGGSEGARALPFDPEGAAPGVEDQARRGLRVFFCFPQNLNDPVWEFRRDLISGSRQPRGFWVVPTVPFLQPSYFVDPDPATGLPRAVYYEGQDPRGGGRIYKAVFERYETFQGILVATEITHYLLGPSAAPSRLYPWEPDGAGEGRGSAAGQDPGAPAAGGEWQRLVLRERISAVEFVEGPRQLAVLPAAVDAFPSGGPEGGGAREGGGP